VPNPAVPNPAVPNPAVPNPAVPNPAVPPRPSAGRIAARFELSGSSDPSRPPPRRRPSGTGRRAARVGGSRKGP
jgi:hypothetical protein